jgi:DNA-binding MarR family transcriptional regulator
VSIAARLSERRLNRQLARLKLTKSGLDALEAVAELEPTTVTDLAALLCVSSQSLGKVLRRLQNLGFLTKERGRDGRTADIRLTPEGRDVLSRAEDLVRAGTKAEDEALFRQQLEQHITELRKTEHTPLPRAGTRARHPGSRGLSPDINTTSLNTTGAHQWPQQTGQPDPRQPSKKQPRQ